MQLFLYPVGILLDQFLDALLGQTPGHDDMNITLHNLDGGCLPSIRADDLNWYFIVADSEIHLNFTLASLPYPYIYPRLPPKIC